MGTLSSAYLVEFPARTDCTGEPSDIHFTSRDIVVLRAEVAVSRRHVRHAVLIAQMRKRRSYRRQLRGRTALNTRSSGHSSTRIFFPFLRKHTGPRQLSDTVKTQAAE